jgi:phosphohistidine swiveling domain-containing protein
MTETADDTLATLATLDDELCTWPEEPRLYTRANGADQWPGPVTPLTQTLVVASQVAALPLTFCERLGLIPPVPVNDCAGVFYGYVAVGLEPTLRMAAVMPGWSAQAVGEQYFGLPPDPAWVDTAPDAGRLRLAGVGLRLLRALRRYPKDTRRFERYNRARWEEACARDWTAASDAELRNEIDAFTAGAPTWRVPLLLANMIAASEYEQLVKLATTIAGDDGPELAARAMSAIGGIQTSQAMDALRSVASGDLSLETWRVRFGFRGPVEYELASRPWGEDDAYLETLLQQARARGDDPEAARRAAAAAATARTELRRRAGVRRPLLAGLLRSLERHLRLRENTKVHEVLAVARLRLAVREAGRRLSARGALGEPDDVHFLVGGELTADIVSATPPDRRATVERRRALHDAVAALELPDLFLADTHRVSTVPPERIRALGLIPPAASSAPRVDDVLAGIGVSPGTATGTARVVTDPFAAELRPGEVLVTRTTDPAWTPLFLDAAAVVIDIGGPLSHGAVIARELGIPCVINVKDGSTRLRTGVSITVDGTAGVVSLDAG